MEMFLCSLFMTSALLVCVLPSAHLAVIIDGSGDDEWSSLVYRVRGLRSTSESDAQPATITATLRPLNPSVPEGGQIRLICTGVTPDADCEYKSFLYKVEGNSEMGDVRPVQASNPTSSQNCSCYTGRCLSSTIFVMTATLQAAGTYGCVVLPNGQPQPTSEIPRSGEPGNRTPETNVTVCEEPDLSLHERSNGNFTTVNASENCNFEGELSWRINGHPVPRESASPAPSAGLSPPAAVHRDNDLLAISKCDRWATRTPCTVTAEFTYISARRLKVAHISTDIHDCCVDLPSTVVPTKPLLTQRPQEETKAPPTPQHRADLSQLPSSTRKVQQKPPRYLAEISAVALGVSTIALGAVACYYRSRWKRLRGSTTTGVPGPVAEVTEV
ncbi:uncharacterized protein LOC119741690 isoform X2 [Patiria miniata]|uniref:Uncharacterized protein n=1 Tax=Patiria miniata TaxID=46514 RepID=A0A914BDF8_PATMI|nr:uncharacterized protein LOC119741690 isoform X2 [Patiria miniata]